MIFNKKLNFNNKKTYIRKDFEEVLVVDLNL